MDMGTDVVSVNQRKANANYKRSYFWFLGSAEEHEWQDLLWRGKKGGGPAPAALLVGVVIGVLSSRVTWLSREQELEPQVVTVFQSRFLGCPPVTCRQPFCTGVQDTVNVFFLLSFLLIFL